MQQFALNALLHASLHAADVLLQNLAESAKWAWFGFKMTSEKCFRSFCIHCKYTLLKNNDILQSVCELEYYAWNFIEPKNSLL